MSIRHKLFISTIIIMIIVLSIITATLYFTDQIKSKEQKKVALDIIASSVQDTIAKLNIKSLPLTEKNKRRIGIYLNRSSYIKNWTLIDKEYNILCFNNIKVNIETIKKDKNVTNLMTNDSLLYQNDILYAPIYTLDNTKMIFIMSIKHLNLNPLSLDKFIFTLIWVMLLGGILLLLNIYIIFYKVIMDPIELLLKNCLNVKKGIYKKIEFNPERNDEFGTLILTYNNMLSSIIENKQNLEGKVKDAVEKSRVLEHRLELTHRLNSIGFLAGGIAHEINNPLGSIVNALNVLKKKECDKEKTLHYIEIIEEGASRIKDIVNKVNEITPKKSTGGTCNLISTLKSTVNLVKLKGDAKNIKILLDLENKNFIIPINEDELKQVFLNIFINAIDAVREDIGEIKVNILEENSLIKVNIEDNGAGIAPEQMEHIFDPFYTTKEQGKGTGLGLSIAYSILKRNNADISINSKKNDGTVVSLIFNMVTTKENRKDD